MSRRICFDTCPQVPSTNKEPEPEKGQEMASFQGETEDADPIQFKRPDSDKEEEDQEDEETEEEEEDCEPCAVSSVLGYFCVCHKDSSGDWMIRLFQANGTSSTLSDPLLEKKLSTPAVKSLVLQQDSKSAFIGTTESITQVTLLQEQEQQRAISVPGGVKEIQASNTSAVIWALSEEGHHLFGWNFETDEDRLVAKDVSAFCVDPFGCVWFAVHDHLFKYDERRNSTDKVRRLCQGVFSIQNVMRDWIVCISACDDKLSFTMCACIPDKTPAVETQFLNDISTDDASRWVVASHPELDFLLVSYGPDSDLYVLQIVDQEGKSLLRKVDLMGQILSGAWESYTSKDWKMRGQMAVVATPGNNAGVVFGFCGKHVWERLNILTCNRVLWQADVLAQGREPREVEQRLNEWKDKLNAQQDKLEELQDRVDEAEREQDARQSILEVVEGQLEKFEALIAQLVEESDLPDCGSLRHDMLAAANEMYRWFDDEERVMVGNEPRIFADTLWYFANYCRRVKDARGRCKK